MTVIKNAATKQMHFAINSLQGVDDSTHPAASKASQRNLGRDEARVSDGRRFVLICYLSE